MAERPFLGERPTPGEGLTWAIDRQFSSIKDEGLFSRGEQWLPLATTDDEGLVGGLPDTVWAVRPHPDLAEPYGSLGSRIETKETVASGATITRIYVIEQGSVAVINGTLQCVVLGNRTEVSDEETGVVKVLDPDAAWRFINWVGRSIVIPPNAAGV